LKREGDADVSDDTQEQISVSRLPPGSTHEVIRDSQGHHSGFTDSRPGYQRLLRMVRQGAIAGVAAYDDSRLNRNAENALVLFRECSTRGVQLLIDNTPPEDRFTPTGEMTYGMVAVVKQHERQAMAKRMRDMSRHLYEAGAHRGNDPYGYRSDRDNKGRLVHPRRLLIEPAEAELVRRLWRDLSRYSLIEVAERLNAAGTWRRGKLWTRDSVKDIARRGRLYLGFVTTKRGLEERPGLHEPILDDKTYADGIVGIMSRARGGRRSKPYRTYLLRGLLHCACGTRMHGETRTKADGREWRYYICPVSYGRKIVQTPCAAKAVPADAAEVVVLNAIERFRLPPDWVDRAREELRRRLGAPKADLAEQRRTRLHARLTNLRKQFEWNDISETEYRAKKEDTQRQLALLPDDSKLVIFDRNRRVMSSLVENMDKASDEQKAKLANLLIEKVIAADQMVAEDNIQWAPAARPFFGLGIAPPEGFGGSVPTRHDLIWYAAQE